MHRWTTLVAGLESLHIYFHARTEEGLTPLHRAVLQDDLKIAELLIDHGATA
jgi:ankyrin repeat protein